jgi:hypothetical protein
MSRAKSVIPIERIASRIYLIRDEKVMLDSDLAELYQVETGALVRAVKRNINRFPDDFAFQLTDPEFEHLRCQIGTSKKWGGRRYAPYAFAEQGVAMLSSVLRSDRAAEVNVAIIRTFVRLRQILASNEDLARKINEHDRKITLLYNAVEKLLAVPEPKKRPIGYIHSKD